MCNSLLQLQDLLESGSMLSANDILAVSKGFTDYKEFSRYRMWRKNSGKSTSLKSSDFMLDLEWWREHIDYASVSVFMKYAKQKGYIITQENLNKFNQWKSNHKLSHSNREEYLELYIKWLNILSERKLFKESKNLKKNNKRSISASSFFSSKKEYGNFLVWCHRSNINVRDLSDKELKEAVELYKEKKSYSERKKNLPWKDDFQGERYGMYSTKRGFSFKKDPERYLEEFQNWSDNIDAEESNNYLRYCESFEYLLSGKESCEDLDNPSKELIELFDSVVEKYYFYRWCSNTNKTMTTKEELLSALNLYRKLGEYKNKLKDIHWVSSNQKQRYYQYCKKLGFSPISDPERYLAGIREWASVVDKNPLVD